MAPVIVAGMLGAAFPAGAQANASGVSCDELAKLTLPEATITAAELVNSGRCKGSRRSARAPNDAAGHECCRTSR